MRSKKAIKNMTFSLLQKLITIICGFIVPKLIISKFGSNTYGLISSITQFLGYIVLLESGFGPVISSLLYKPLAKKDEQTIVNILVSSERFFRRIAYIFLFYIFILIIIFPTIINKDFNFLFTSSLVIIIACSTFAEYYFGMTYKLFISANQESYIISVIQIITTILNTTVVMILVKMNANIQLIKLISALVFVLRPIIQNIYVKKKYNIDLSKGDKNYKIANKWDGLAQHIAAVVHNNTDVTILTLLSTLGEVSVYSVYYLVINGIKNMIMSLTGGIDASFGDMIAKGEIENLNKKFRYYELFYYSVITIIYSCTLILIIPFIKIYTYQIKDVNYIRPLFGSLLVLAGFSHAIRLPYSSITLSAGHFKQTMKGAWIEAISNITISVILVFKFGIIGVAIGTLVAMIIRTIEFIIHSSKYILYRNIFISFNRIFIVLIELFVVYIIGNIIINYININNYFMFMVVGFILFIISSFVVILINLIFYKDDFVGIKLILKNIIKK